MFADHYIVTRFNVPWFVAAPGANVKQAEVTRASAFRTSDNWLRSRVSIFERFCLPSVAHQTEKKFKWLVYLDAASPSWLRARSVQWHATAPLLEARWVRSRSAAELIAEDLLPRLKLSASDLVATTRLDSDDAINKRFMEVLMSRVRRETRAYNFTHGYEWHAGRVCKTVNRANAFVTIVEARGSRMRGVYFCSHTKIPKHLPTEQIAVDPFWLVTYHGESLSRFGSTRAVGTWTPAAKIAAAFGLSNKHVSAT